MRNGLIILFTVCFIGAAVVAASLAVQKQQKPNTAASVVNQETPDDVEIIQPQLDLAAGREALIEPEIGGTIQVKTNRGVSVSITIPPGTLKKARTISLIPFLEDGKRGTLDAGVLITPGSTVFTTPITLTFGTKATNVFRVLPKKQSVVPVLIYRDPEERTVTQARITAGGAYVFSKISSRAEALSRVVLADKNSLSDSILEAGSYLAGTGNYLSEREMAMINAAITDNTALKSLPTPEFYAAMALQNKLNGTTQELPSVPVEEEISGTEIKKVTEKADIYNTDGYTALPTPTPTKEILPGN